MAGGNLEIFKFAFYTGVPLGMLWWFSRDQWFNDHVIPHGDKIFGQSAYKVPHTQSDIQSELSRMKHRLAERERNPDQSQPVPSTTSSGYSAATVNREIRKAADSTPFTRTEPVPEHSAFAAREQELGRIGGAPDHSREPSQERYSVDRQRLV